MSKCTKAGREHSQAAGPSWPRAIFHTIDARLNTEMEVGRGHRDLCVPPSLLGDRLHNRLLGSEKNCTEYYFFCVFFITIPSLLSY